MERKALIELWDGSWQDGLWAVPWSKVLEGLTASQAAWKPHPARHSIWQIAHHLLFWRQVTLHFVRGEPEPDQSETERRSWEEPSQSDTEAWRENVHRFETSQREMVEALTAADRGLERFHYHLLHDSYHIGQIMQLRAMQGLAPIV